MAEFWSLYAPDAAMPWDVRRVAHLHRRAGFAATWGEIRRDLKDGPSAAIDRLLAGRASMHVASRFEPTADLLADAAISANEPARLKAWWVFHILFGPDPLGEKLTLLWHDHFATSNAKVQDLSAMRRQNKLFRRHSKSPFGDLLNAVVRDPALLIYLDAPANRKGHPNENLARELMELFTLGIGHYTEADVKEAARALTGWTVADGEFQVLPAAHDPGEKTILGAKGKWNGDELVKRLLDHPATSERLAFKLCRLFFGEHGVPDGAKRELAAGLRANKLEIGWAVGTILRSRAFFDESNIGSKIRGPVDFVVGTARALEMFKDAPSTLALADWCGRLGQDLFEPPNVGGWPGGRAWVSARTLISRANYVAALLDGPSAGRRTAFEPAEFAKSRGFMNLRDCFAPLLGIEPGTINGDGRRWLAGLLTSPEALLG